MGENPIGCGFGCGYTGAGLILNPTVFFLVGTKKLSRVHALDIYIYIYVYKYLYVYIGEIYV
jgi:hypothetical protein